MGIELKTVSIKPGSSGNVQFTSTVKSFVYGIQNFDLTYGTQDHKVATIAVKLTANVNDCIIKIQVNATLDDESGNQLDADSSSVLVCVLAVTNDSDQNLIFDIESGVQNAAQPFPIDGTFDIDQSLSAVAGFNISYGAEGNSVDHKVEKVNFSSGITISTENNNTTATLTALASMFDDDGHTSQNPTLDLLMILTDTNAMCPLFKILANEQTGNSTEEIECDFGQPVLACGAFIQSYTVSYDDTDHRVRSIGGGVSACTVDLDDNTKVKVKAPHSYMSDQDTDHRQDDSKSNVTMLVVAIPLLFDPPTA